MTTLEPMSPEKRHERIMEALFGGTEANLPYPWCREPERCASLGYCPRDPSCGD